MTGALTLPTLPEGYYWFVEKNTHPMSQSMFAFRIYLFRTRKGWTRHFLGDVKLKELLGDNAEDLKLMAKTMYREFFIPKSGPDLTGIYR